MLRTKSSQSYNPMDQNSNTNPNPAQTSLQQQLYQLSQTVDTVVRRLDVMDVRRHYDDVVMEGVNLEEERLEATTLPSRVIQQVRARKHTLPRIVLAG
ncbi:unnamed protein product [Ilex paraguariensis]|uniref:Uncharacterized protein n=1 Tax=Ilex paraguariensis TaxID=185542 RepID=A0ABC8S9M3_9AQUA